MRVGVTLPSMGHLAQPSHLVEVAQAAERLGYDTLWTPDRLLYPLGADQPIFAGSLDQVKKALRVIEWVKFAKKCCS